SESKLLSLPMMNLIRLKGASILQQLHLEERLLRTSLDNWCIINDGTTKPTIVMGVSGKPEELVKIESVLRDDIPVIRRFTGGGTVIVDQDTIFVTFICNRGAVPGLQLYPQPIYSWSGRLYEKVFRGGVGDFRLRENDYVLGDRKFGGNAQSITKQRWILHTSFLWDYKTSNMAYLKHPERAPAYRQGRSHVEFICRLKEYMPKSTFIDRTIDAVGLEFALNGGGSTPPPPPPTSKFQPSSRALTRQDFRALTGET
ncbi:hypothetical protein M569_07283, partial [Genlisea aurea]